MHTREKKAHGMITGESFVLKHTHNHHIITHSCLSLQLTLTPFNSLFGLGHCAGWRVASGDGVEKLRGDNVLVSHQGEDELWGGAKIEHDEMGCIVQPISLHPDANTAGGVPDAGEMLFVWQGGAHGENGLPFQGDGCAVGTNGDG